MNHKLINRTTNEEHICQKVTIDGFDYYVSDGTENRSGKIAFINNEVYKNELRVVTTAFGNDNLKDCKKVIATNNPNIDIPKVVDEVEILLEKEQQESYKNGKGTISWYEKDKRREYYNKSQETHSFSEEDMLDFALFLDIFLREKPRKTHRQLLQLWKEQKPKIVYYE